MPDQSPQQREHAAREAREQLKTLGDSESLFAGSIGQAARRAAAHFAGRGDGSDDAVEIWGKRIGRALSLGGVIALALYLWLVYLR